jgi:hypothetical protein
MVWEMRRWLPLVLLAGCGTEDRAVITELSGYRVLAVRAEPPEVPPEGRFTLRAVDFAPGDETARRRAPYTWTLCPLSLGALANYRCLHPSLEVVLAAEAATVEVDLGPRGPFAPAGYAALIDGARCLLSGSAAPECAAAQALAPPEVVAQLDALDATLRADLAAQLDLDAGLDLQVRLSSGVPEAPLRTAIKRVHVRRLADDEVPRRNPNIDAIAGVSTVDGAETVFALQVRVDAPLDPALGLISWYSTEGTWNQSRSEGDEITNTLRVPTEALPVQIAVTIRDGLGGVDARLMALP